MMAADYRHIGGVENRLGRHYSRFSPFWPAASFADQSLALRKSWNAGSNRRSQASILRTGMLVSSKKTVVTDHKFASDESSSRFSNHVFVRLVAVGRTFTKVDFRYTFFDACYLRNCRFDSCDFTGCRFANTQLPGAKFSGCKFDYATFEKTLIDTGVLDTECPGLENLKMRFARSLRTNFQQLGDADAVNKAMRVELSATEIHLKKAWQSNESYYRSQHPG